MRFSFYSEEKDYIGELLYIRDEHSFLYKPYNTNAGVSILIGGYTELDTILETSEVTHVSGFCHKNTWIIKSINVPNSKKGCLIAHFDKPPMKGTGIEYDRSLETYYDEEKQYICIGDYCIEDTDDCVEFANNIIAVLRNGDLVAIWAKIKMV